MVLALAGDSTMTSRGPVAAGPPFAPARAGGDAVRSAAVDVVRGGTALLGSGCCVVVRRVVQLAGQASSGTPSGGSPTSSRRRASRRPPTRRYAGPSARGPRNVAGRPAAASAVPTTGQTGSAFGPTASR